MLVATIRRLRTNRHGISNVIVVMLSLVLVVIIVSNVVLWSYQMNEIDWEKMQEKLNILNVERTSNSPWFTAKQEYTVNGGSRTGGAYNDTQTIDGTYESFLEGSNLSQPLSIDGDFVPDLVSYPFQNVRSIEIQAYYRANNSLENWFLKAYNWTSGDYEDAGFNSTLGDSPSSAFGYYGVAMINDWQSYIQNNTMKLMFSNERVGANQTYVDVDFLGARLVINEAGFIFTNEGSMVSHIVSIWIINSTIHTRYDTDFFVDSGASSVHIEFPIALPADGFTVRAVTERGNIAVFNKS